MLIPTNNLKVRFVTAPYKLLIHEIFHPTYNYEKCSSKRGSCKNCPESNPREPKKTAIWHYGVIYNNIFDIISIRKSIKTQLDYLEKDEDIGALFNYELSFIQDINNKYKQYSIRPAVRNSYFDNKIIPNNYWELLQESVKVPYIYNTKVL
jgi:hypothetical protein